MPGLTRTESIVQAAVEVLLGFQDHIDGDSGLRSIQMTIHLHRDPSRPSRVQDVVVSFQSVREMSQPRMNGAVPV